MKSALTIAIVLALGASPVLAKATYCKDPTTHKRISCKVAAAPAAAAAPAKAAMAAPAAKPAKHSFFAKKPAMATTAPAPTAMAASGLTAIGKPHKGIKCGNSYIAANKVCHKN